MICFKTLVMLVVLLNLLDNEAFIFLGLYFRPPTFRYIIDSIFFFNLSYIVHCTFSWLDQFTNFKHRIPLSSIKNVKLTFIETRIHFWDTIRIPLHVVTNHQSQSVHETVMRKIYDSSWQKFERFIEENPPLMHKR